MANGRSKEVGEFLSKQLAEKGKWQLTQQNAQTFRRYTLILFSLYASVAFKFI